jgi:hypothetical protein
MKKWTWTLALALALAPAVVAGEKDKAASEPFYRKYLVPGNPLDDQIVEQERRVEASPEDASLRNDFGNLLAKRRFPEQAAEQYERAAKLDKNNFISLYNLGLLRETEGKTGAAVSAYKKSISRKPGFPPSRFRLGRLYERQGRSDDAVREYAIAMRIDPSMREARRNPLVVDTELLYLASVQNYSRDLATASMQSDQVYIEEARFRQVPVDRAVAAAEVAEEEAPIEAEPREIGPTGAVPGVTEPGAKPPTRRSGRPPAPAETGGSVLGGRSRTPGARPPRMNRPTPRPPGSVAPAPAPVPAAPPPDEFEPTGDPAEPETVPEPTPTPGAPEEVEPS